MNTLLLAVLFFAVPCHAQKFTGPAPTVSGPVVAGSLAPHWTAGFSGFSNWLGSSSGAAFLNKNPQWARLKAVDFNDRFAQQHFAAKLPAEAAAAMADPQAVAPEALDVLVAAVAQADSERVQEKTRWNVLKQALRLPKTLLEIHRIVKGEYTPEAMDENLWAHRGFHTTPSDPHYRQRSWKQVAAANLRKDQVVGITHKEMSTILRTAMEVEDPILDYSRQSGEGFRYLLPSLGRFMGKNEEQAKYAEENKLPWCESAWCSEERRHGPTLAKMTQVVTGAAPARDNPNDVTKVAANEQEAIAHILSREATEWNASSVYVLVAAHTTGEMRELITNVMRDEIKHLSVVSGADKYLFGPRPWGRFRDLLKVALDFLQYHRKNRSDGAEIASNPVTLLELGATHLMSEYYTRKWLKSVPLDTLREVFEPVSNLPELAAFKPSPEQQAKIDQKLAEGRKERDALRRWPFDEAKKAAILDAVAERIALLSPEEIGRLKGEEGRLARKILSERKRAEEIANNRHVKDNR